MERRIGLELKQVSNLIKRSMDSRHAGQTGGITAVQGWLLGYLYHEAEIGGRTVLQRDLEGEFQIRRSSVTGLLQTMEKNGVVTRAPVEGDGRQKKLLLTERGRAICLAMEAAMEESEAALARDITPGDMEIFWRVLDQIRVNTGQSAPHEAV